MATWTRWVVIFGVPRNSVPFLRAGSAWVRTRSASICHIEDPARELLESVVG